MKQLIPFLFLFIVLTGCKKEDSKQKEVLLTEVSTDGVVSTRIHYDADNRLTRYEGFGGGVLSSYLTTKYDANGHISELSSYGSPGDIPYIRILIQCDNDGKFTKATTYELQGPTPNTPTTIATYSYNSQGQMIKIERRDNSNVFISSINLFYFPDGNLKEYQTFKEANNLLWMSGKTIYSVPNGFYPKGTDKLRMALGPDVAASLFSESIHSYTYDQNGGMLTHTSRMMSGREFNNDGSLKKQVETYTSIKPPQAAIVYNKSYEYILQ